MGDFNSQKNRAVWFDLPVRDLGRAVNFYSAVLGIRVFREQFGETEFAVLEHEDGNGGCLVINPDGVSETGLLLYLNADGRLRDAVAQVEAKGGKVLQPIHGLGPHGFRAVILDSEGNRVALHSNTDV